MMEPEDLSRPQKLLLEDLARRFIWWKSVEEAMRWPRAILLQGMDLGSLEDMLAMEQMFGTDNLIECVRTAEAGQLSPRSWSYWHYRLGIMPENQVPPPQPVRAYA